MIRDKDNVFSNGTHLYYTKKNNPAQKTEQDYSYEY